MNLTTQISLISNLLSTTKNETNPIDILIQIQSDIRSEWEGNEPG